MPVYLFTKSFKSTSKEYVHKSLFIASEATQKIMGK